ncbi:MAG TPA: AvaI/BsoBI family type II restriction endonuclease [Pirellulales bacterium]|nr:AvaI/BsoBI family type II restriction endonuclease [Pirellulales bacterium]
MLPKSIRSAADLVTSDQSTIDGFVAQAIEKGRLARPFVEQGRQFREALNKATDVHSLLMNPVLRDHLLAAAGLSEKAQNSLSHEQENRALDRILGMLAAGGGDQWRDELLYRFLLTRGDSLGGAMRNVTGAVAGRKLVASIMRALNARQIKPELTKSTAGKVQLLRWENRLLAFDKTPRFIGNNIDVILLDVTGTTASFRELLESPARFLACGELKGGIDPAGADEHWKTADSALGRIREVFREQDSEKSLAGKKVQMFIAVAAVEEVMAREIFEQLQSGKLSSAANLTVPAQLQELAAWLVDL